MQTHMHTRTCVYTNQLKQITSDIYIYLTRPLSGPEAHATRGRSSIWEGLATSQSIDIILSQSHANGFPDNVMCTVSFKSLTYKIRRKMGKQTLHHIKLKQ